MLARSVPSGQGTDRAGISASENIDWREYVGVEGPDVGMAGDAGPVPCKDRATGFVVLTLPGDGHPRSLEAEIDSADAGEQASCPERAIHALTPDSSSTTRAVATSSSRRGTHISPVSRWWSSRGVQPCSLIAWASSAS